MARRKKAAAENGAGTAVAEPPTRSARQVAAFVLGELGHAVLERLAPSVSADEWMRWTVPGGTDEPGEEHEELLRELEERATLVRAFNHENGTHPDATAPLATLRAGLADLRAHAAAKRAAESAPAEQPQGDQVAGRLARKEFSFVTVSWREVRPAGDDWPAGWAPGRRSFVVWEHRKKKASERALAFWSRVQGEEVAKRCEFDIYPRNYVREAEALAASGWHDEAPWVSDPDAALPGAVQALVAGDLIPASEWRTRDAATLAAPGALGDPATESVPADRGVPADRDTKPENVPVESDTKPANVTAPEACSRAALIRGAERAAVSEERARIVAALEEVLERANAELGDLDTKPAAMKVAQVTAHVARQAIAIVRGTPGDAGPLFEGLDS